MKHSTKVLLPAGRKLVSTKGLVYHVVKYTNSRVVTIKFLESGEVTSYAAHLVLTGRVTDNSKNRKPEVTTEAYVQWQKLKVMQPELNKFKDLYAFELDYRNITEFNGRELVTKVYDPKLKGFVYSPGTLMLVSRSSRIALIGLYCHTKQRTCLRNKDGSYTITKYPDAKRYSLKVANRKELLRMLALIDLTILDRDGVLGHVMPDVTHIIKKYKITYEEIEDNHYVSALDKTQREANVLASWI